MPSIRVVSWNLQWFPGGKPDATSEESAQHMAAAQAVLKDLKPEILLLQEVRDWDAAQELCSVVPGLNVQVASRFQPRAQNQIIASKYPADSAWSEAWKSSTIDPPRGYSFAAITLPDNGFLLSYSLHLKSNLGEPARNVIQRQEAARQVLQHAQEMLKLYSRRGPSAVLIAGDMNTSLDDARFEKEQTLRGWKSAGLRWTFEAVPFPQRITIPADDGFPDNCFDHIFTAGLGQQTAAVKPYPGISDHNPVILDVDLAKAEWKPKLDRAAGEALLRSAQATPPPRASAIPSTSSISAGDDARIRAAVGEVVTISGAVQNVGQSRTGSIFFINFIGNHRGQFTGIVKRADYQAVVAALGSDLKTALAGKRIELRGTVELYNDTPQIVVTSGEQVRVLD